MLINHIEKTSDKSRPRFPRLGTTDNPRFDSKNATAFLKNFESLIKDVLAEFLDFDVDRLISIPAYLEKLYAMHRKELSKYSRTKLLLRGLPYSIAGHIVRKAHIKERDTKTFENFNNILRITKEAIELRHDISRLMHEDTREDIATLV
ncbi:hypothetical protein Q7P36_007741 [Cladosporium allicinum]